MGGSSVNFSGLSNTPALDKHYSLWRSDALHSITTLQVPSFQCTSSLSFFFVAISRRSLVDLLTTSQSVKAIVIVEYIFYGFSSGAWLSLLIFELASLANPIEIE